MQVYDFTTPASMSAILSDKPEAARLLSAPYLPLPAGYDPCWRKSPHHARSGIASTLITSDKSPHW
jgi:hypothetical protein